MAGYVKMFQCILDSTIWETSPEVTKVWLTMLAMADRYGEVRASVPGLARRSFVPRAAAERALKSFLLPDRDSRTAADDGRRIERIDGGWRVINYEKYREMDGLSDRRKKDAERQRRRYHRLKGEDASREPNVTNGDSRETSQLHPHLPSASPSPAAEQIRSEPRVGSAPLGRTGPRPRTRTGGIDLVAGTDRKLGELRDAATRAATPEEIEELRRARGTGAA